MIDTVTIRYDMNACDAKMLISNMSIRVPDSTKRIEDFLDTDDLGVWSLKAYKKVDIRKVSAGLILLRWYKHGLKYYLEVSLNLEALIENKKTTRLFVSNPINIDILQRAYADMVKQLFPNIDAYNTNFEYDGHDFLPSRFTINGLSSLGIAKLPYLALCQVLRIDYTVNLSVDDKNTYLYLLGKSFQEIDRFYMLGNASNNNVSATTQTVKFDDNQLIKDSRTGKLKPKSIKSQSPFTRINFYDKSLKYFEEGAAAELVEEASNIVRYELSYHRVHHWTDERLKRKLHVENGSLCGLLPWLDESVAMESLTEIYNRHIGNATYYKKYTFKKIIDSSDFGYKNQTSDTRYKARLVDIAELISRAHSVRLAKQQFLEGTTIGKPPRVLKGSSSDFNALIQDIISIGIMPLRLPEYGSTKAISTYVNPFKQYEAGMPALPGYLFSYSNLDSIYGYGGVENTVIYHGNISLFAYINECNKGRSSFKAYFDAVTKSAVEAKMIQLEEEVQKAETAQVIREIEELEQKDSIKLAKYQETIASETVMHII